MSKLPWKDLLENAEHVRESHQPEGDNAHPARRDVQLVLSACINCRMLLELARSEDESLPSTETLEALEALEAIDELLRSFLPVLQGVGTQTRKVAMQCKRAADDGERGAEDLRAVLHEISTELHSLVAPGSEDCA